MVYVFLDLLFYILMKQNMNIRDHTMMVLVGGGASGSGNKMCCVILFIEGSENFRD